MQDSITLFSFNCSDIVSYLIGKRHQSYLRFILGFILTVKASKMAPLLDGRVLTLSTVAVTSVLLPMGKLLL